MIGLPRDVVPHVDRIRNVIRAYSTFQHMACSGTAISENTIAGTMSSAGMRSAITP